MLWSCLLAYYVATNRRLFCISASPQKTPTSDVERFTSQHVLCTTDYIYFAFCFRRLSTSFRCNAPPSTRITDKWRIVCPVCSLTPYIYRCEHAGFWDQLINKMLLGDWVLRIDDEYRMLDYYTSLLVVPGILRWHEFSARGPPLDRWELTWWIQNERYIVTVTI